MKKRFNYLFLIITILGLSACSNDSNPVETLPQSTITGKWVSEGSTWINGEYTDSLRFQAEITEKNGVITGTGSFAYLKSDSLSRISGELGGDITGTYSKPNISIVLSNLLDDAKYTYTGTWETEGINFFGDGIYTDIDTFNFPLQYFFIMPDS